MRFDWPQDSAPSTAVVAAVAAVEDVPPAELPPLHDSIEADALDTLLEHRPDADEPGALVRFAYAEYVVTVSRQHGVHLEPDADVDVPSAAPSDGLDPLDDPDRDVEASRESEPFDATEFDRCDPVTRPSAAESDRRPADASEEDVSRDRASEETATDATGDDATGDDGNEADASEGSGTTGQSSCE